MSPFACVEDFGHEKVTPTKNKQKPQGVKTGKENLARPRPQEPPKGRNIDDDIERQTTGNFDFRRVLYTR